MTQYDGDDIKTGGIGTDNQDESAPRLTVLNCISRFQILCIWGIASAAEPVRGVDVRQQIEVVVGEAVNHGRLYPNLDDLEEKGLIEIGRGEIDDRTNRYRITDEGWEVYTDLIELLLLPLSDVSRDEEARDSATSKAEAGGSR